MGTRTRWLWRAALAGAGALIGVGLLAGAAAAHATLQSASPTPDSVLAAAPARIVLDFDEPVTLMPGQARVIGPGGARADRGVAVLTKGGHEVVIGLRAHLGEGGYTVGYRVVSADSHPVAGGYSFQVGTAPRVGPVRGGAGGVTGGDAPEVGAVSTLYGVARYAGFVGLVLLVGGGVFLVGLWPSSVPAQRSQRLVWLGYWVVLTGAVVELVVQVPYAEGSGLAGVTAAGLGRVISSEFGIAHLVRIGLLVAGGPLLVAALRGARRVPEIEVAALALTVAVLLTWPLAGHGGVRDPGVSVPSDTVHLAAMSVWLGGLVMLGSVLLPMVDLQPLGPVLTRWSVVAMTSVVLLVATGTVQTLLEVGGWGRLVDTTYGRLVLAKASLLALILCFANVSRRWVRRNCTPARTVAVAHRRDLGVLRRSVLAETGLAVVVVALAAVLVATTPGRGVSAAAADVAAAREDQGRPVHGGPYSVAVARGSVVVHLVVDPGRVGQNIVHLSATRPDQNRVTVQEWTLTVSNSAAGLADIAVPLHWVGGQSVGDLLLPTAGDWTLRVAARTTDVDEVVLRRVVSVR